MLDILFKIAAADAVSAVAEDYGVSWEKEEGGSGGGGRCRGEGRRKG